MKQVISKKYIALTVGFVIVLSAVVVHAGGVWNLPTSAAPAGNLDVPVHIGFDQAKQIGSTAFNSGGLSVNGFMAGNGCTTANIGTNAPCNAPGNAWFDQQTFFDGSINGGTQSSPNGSVIFGGSANTVGVTTTGSVSVLNSIKSQTVANTSSKKLCADATGLIIVCP